MIDVNILKQIFTGNTGSQSVQNNFYATVISQNDNEILVQLDGSNLTLPIIVGDGGANTVSVSSNDRVLVRIENNRAFIDSNVGDISASSADVAQNTENIGVAVEAADTAMSAAEEANTAAQNATDAAASATSAAATAQSAAESAITDAGEALTKANAADAKAVTAQSTAESAASDASDALSAAGAADTKATTAAQNATNALATANTAQSTADAAQATANAAQTAADDAIAKTQHIEFSDETGLHIFEGENPSIGSDLNLKSNAMNFLIDGENVSTRQLIQMETGVRLSETNTLGYNFIADIHDQQSPTSIDQHPKASIEVGKLSRYNQWTRGGATLVVLDDSDGLDGFAYIGVSGATYYNYQSPTSYRMAERAQVLIRSNGNAGALSDWITSSVIRDSAYRTAALSDYSDVNTSGWNYEIYASGKVHATAIIRWRAAMTTQHQGWYRSATIYTPLPVEMSKILSVNYGLCMGGSSFGEVFCYPGGNIATWDGSQNVHSLQYLGFARNSTTSPSGDIWYYTPVDVWGVLA